MASINTLSTDTWDVLYTYLQTTNPIATNNIFSAFNSALVKNKGYPLVIMYTPVSSFNKLNLTGEHVLCDLSVLFEIYHTSSQNVKVLKDEVIAKLLAGRKSFAGEGLKRMNIDQGDYSTWEEGNKKIHRVSFSVLFTFSEVL